MPEVPSTDGPRKYDPVDPQSILEFGRRVIGLSAREISLRSGMPDPSNRPEWRGTKNVLGDVMEWYYGIRKNNSPDPDFPQAKVELKILPLKRGRGRLLVKEPTSISMIDYMTLLEEVWEGNEGRTRATVRKKLDHILFVFFVINQNDVMASIVRDVVLWEPEPLDNTIFQLDWQGTWKMVADGQAHGLSETQAKALAARRKGIGGPKDKGRSQPRSPILAPSRAWALKSAFTRQIFEEIVLKKPFVSAFGDLLPAIRARGLAPAEERILASLRAYEGVQLRAVMKDDRALLKGSKNLAATLVKRCLGFENGNSRIKELEQLGIDVKTIHLSNKDGHLFESVSFPVVDLLELVKEDWAGIELEDGTIVKERSDLIDQVHRILFVPTYSDESNDPQERRRLGRPFFWTPSETELAVIDQEWRMFQAEVAEGWAKYDKPCGEKGRHNNLTPASRTKIIHMRPHGRTACDEYLDPCGNAVTKQSFWLNVAFVWKLVKENHAFPPKQPNEN